MGISLGALAGLPPSPLFLSEVLIVAGGFQAGRSWAAAATALLLALGFLGLAHALLETTVGKARRRDVGAARRLAGSPCSPAPRSLLLLGLSGRRALAARLRARRRAAAGNLVSEHGTRSYRDEIAAALAEGWRFAGLHATSDGARVRTLLADPRRERRGSRRSLAQDGAVPSIVDLAPAAGWDEREAHDLHGVGFAGHEPLRPLVDHDLRPRPLDGARARPRRVPGRRRADPRRA